jgi:fumarate reductase subunit D
MEAVTEPTRREAPVYEVWVRSNRRVMLVACVAPLLLLVLGLAVATNVLVDAPWIARVLAGLLAGLGAMFLSMLLWYGRMPRLAYDGRHLLVFLRTSGPLEVPIEIVECFLLGSGLRRLPGRSGREVQVVQLGVRLAERAAEWAQIEVKAALGKWCGGTITIYGTWCEPLTFELVNKLNARLHAAQRQQRERLVAEA